MQRQSQAAQMQQLCRGGLSPLGLNTSLCSDVHGSPGSKSLIDVQGSGRPLSLDNIEVNLTFGPGSWRTPWPAYQAEAHEVMTRVSEQPGPTSVMDVGVRTLVETAVLTEFDDQLFIIILPSPTGAESCDGVTGAARATKL